MQLYRFVIPNIGTFVTRGRTKADAIRIVQLEIQRRGFPLNITEIMQSLDAGIPIFSSDITPDDTYLSPDILNDATGGSGGSGGGGGNTTVSTPGDPSTALERELAAPTAVFRSVLRQRGLPTGGVVGSLLESQVPGAVNFRTLAEALQGPGGIGEESLSQTFSDLLNNQRGLGAQAQQTLAGLAGLSNPNATQQPFLNVSSFGSDPARAVRELALSALGGSSPFLASTFSDEIDRQLGRRFQDRVFQGTEPENFAGFLRQNLGFG